MSGFRTPTPMGTVLRVATPRQRLADTTLNRRRTPGSIAGRVVVLAFAATMVLAAGASAHTTQGNATPANMSAHPWPENGCTLSPDSGPGFNFRHACAHHDGCYIGFPRNGRPTYWTSRAQCDAWFYYDMTASCRWQHGPNPQDSYWGRRCLQAASTYYNAVRQFGRPYYKGPWNN